MPGGPNIHSVPDGCTIWFCWRHQHIFEVTTKYATTGYSGGRQHTTYKTYRTYYMRLPWQWHPSRGFWKGQPLASNPVMRFESWRLQFWSLTIFASLQSTRATAPGHAVRPRHINSGGPEDGNVATSEHLVDAQVPRTWMPAVPPASHDTGASLIPIRTEDSNYSRRERTDGIIEGYSTVTVRDVYRHGSSCTIIDTTSTVAIPVSMWKSFKSYTDNVEYGLFRALILVPSSYGAEFIPISPASAGTTPHTNHNQPQTVPTPLTAPLETGHLQPQEKSAPDNPFSPLSSASQP